MAQHFFNSRMQRLQTPFEVEFVSDDEKTRRVSAKNQREAIERALKSRDLPIVDDDRVKSCDEVDRRPCCASTSGDVCTIYVCRRVALLLLSDRLLDHFPDRCCTRITRLAVDRYRLRVARLTGMWLSAANELAASPISRWHPKSGFMLLRRVFDLLFVELTSGPYGRGSFGARRRLFLAFNFVLALSHFGLPSDLAVLTARQLIVTARARLFFCGRGFDDRLVVEAAYRDVVAMLVVAQHDARIQLTICKPMETQIWPAEIIDMIVAKSVNVTMPMARVWRGSVGSQLALEIHKTAAVVRLRQLSSQWRARVDWHLTRSPIPKRVIGVCSCLKPEELIQLPGQEINELVPIVAFGGVDFVRQLLPLVARGRERYRVHLREDMAPAQINDQLRHLTAGERRAHRAFNLHFQSAGRRRTLTLERLQFSWTPNNQRPQSDLRVLIE